jgi:hypothetical protein
MTLHQYNTHEKINKKKTNIDIHLYGAQNIDIKCIPRIGSFLFVIDSLFAFLTNKKQDIHK